MTRIRCPTVSSLSSGHSNGSASKAKSSGGTLKRSPALATVVEDEGPVAGPSTAPSAGANPQLVHKLDKGKGKARSRAKMDVGEKEKLRMAKKKAEMKAARQPQPEWSFVYVGNLSSTVTEEQVAALFQPCGTIRRIVIRASTGVCVPTNNLKKSPGLFGFGGGVEHGVHYATVEFVTPAEARLALELNGAELDGRNILVSLNIVDLPEVSNIIKGHIAQKDPHQEKRTLWQVKFGQLKRLTIERTEHVPDGEERSGPARFVEGVAMRLGLYEPAGPNSTAAGAHQKRAGGGRAIPNARARHTATALKAAKQIIFPRTLF
ncbi:hypothetical protein C8Q73DRAFT_695262 [Cubamyces lactineus]|nr:hypothetical protein C8Q73DRAFT_695262 [Cubamyces lactineus]